MPDNPLRTIPVAPSIPQGGEDLDSDDVLRDLSRSRTDSMRAFWEAAEAPDNEPRPPFVPPAQRRLTLPAPLSFSVVREFADVIQPWHAALGSAAVDRAAESLAEAVALAEEAADAVRSLPADQAAESARIRAASAADAEPPTSTDWAAEQEVRRGRYDGRRASAHEAKRHYLAVVSSEAQGRIPALVEGVEEARAKAAPKFASAATSIRGAIAALRAVHAADVALGLQPEGWHRSPTPSLGSEALEGLAAVEMWLSSDDPVVATGEYVLDESDDLPEHTAQALRESERQIDDWVYQQLVRGGHVPADRSVPESVEIDPGFADALSRKDLPR